MLQDFQKNSFGADLAIILGSGVQCEFQDVLKRTEISYAEIPNFPEARVAGHAGKITLLELKNKKILLFQGRFHLYEGRSIIQVQSIVRLIHAWEVKKLVITNAAGGISADFTVPDLMLIDSVQNLQIPVNPERGLLENLTEKSLEIKSPLMETVCTWGLKTGRYGAVLGPNYETFAEICLLENLGCKAVGMSTYLELLYCMEHKINVVAISVITNSWKLKDQLAPTHQEVLENSKKAQEKLNKLFLDILN